MAKNMNFSAALHHPSQTQDMIIGQGPQIEDNGSAICTGEEAGSINGSNEACDNNKKALKKPEKLLLCPRCNSMNTKFCYYNNYSVNQPRHFCKNCQRYWTAGGALRNVPAGAGRRKAKRSHAHQRHASFDGNIARDDSPDAALSLSAAPKPQLFPSHGSSLASSESQSSRICESMASTSRNLPRQGGVTEHEARNMATCFSQEAEIGLSDRHLVKQDGFQNCFCGETKEKALNDLQNWQQVEESTLSSVTTHCRDCKTATVDELKEVHAIPSERIAVTEAAPTWINQVPFPLLNGPWEHGLTPLVSSFVKENNCLVSGSSSSIIQNDNINGGNSVQDAALAAANLWNTAPPGIWAGIPWALMNATMWNPASWASIYSMSLAVATAAAFSSGMANPELSTSVRKHPRERMESEGGKEGSLLIPKTLRIHDPGEAAKSSIWTTLGLGYRTEPKTYDESSQESYPKIENMETEDSSVQAHQANPAVIET